MDFRFFRLFAPLLGSTLRSGSVGCESWTCTSGMIELVSRPLTSFNFLFFVATPSPSSWVVVASGRSVPSSTSASTSFATRPRFGGIRVAGVYREELCGSGALESGVRLVECWGRSSSGARVLLVER